MTTSNPFLTAQQEHINRVFKEITQHLELTNEQKAALNELLPDNLKYHQQHRIGIKEISRYIHISNLLEARLKRPDPKPEPGDRMLIGCKNGKVYENALLTGDYYHRGPGHSVVVMEASAHIDYDQPFDKPMAMSISGGYFKGIKTAQIESTPHDIVPSRYWFWGDRPCAAGGMYITKPMLRWTLTEIDPEFY